MDVENILPLLKANLNITQNVRDEYLKAILNGVLVELQDEQGVVLSEANPYHIQFVVDFAGWRYRSRGEDGAMPQHLRFRLNNILIRKEASENV